MWLRDHTSLTLACVYVTLLGAMAILMQRNAVPSTMAHSKISNTGITYALGGLAWPFIWVAICGHAVDAMPWAGYVGLIWPPLLLMLDVVFMQHQTGQDPHRQSHGIQMDGNTLSGLALTLGAVLARGVSNGFASAAQPMMMATVLLALLIILPSPTMNALSTHATVFRGVQKVALQYCLGFTITAVAIAFSVGMRAPAQGSSVKAIRATPIAAQETRKPFSAPHHSPSTCKLSSC